jgi:hypothetical protein
MQHLTIAQIQFDKIPANIISYVVIGGVLLLLIILFFYFLKKTDRLVEERERKNNLSNNLEIKKKSNDEPTEEISAAIALALSMYKTQLTEQETLTVTIQKVSKMYSPWSSKIYSLRQLPR